MAITATQSKGKGVLNIAVGRYIDTGTAAAFKITTGFKPRYVRVVNLTDRTEMEWFEGMAAASQLHIVAAGTRSLVTTNGITVADDGFTVGLDTEVNVQSKQLSWIAIGD